MERKGSSRPYEISRRQFLAGGAGFLLALGVEKEPHRFYTEEEKLYEVLQMYPFTRFYFHNAANNPHVLEIALASPVRNIEIDVVNRDDKLYCAHTTEELERMTTAQQEGQELERIIRKVVEAGKNPAFDLKLNPLDQEGFNKFRDFLKKIVPIEIQTTISGTFDLVMQLAELEDFPEGSIVVPTPKNPHQLDEFIKRVEEWKARDNNIRRGITISSNLAFSRIDPRAEGSPRVLEFIKENGLEANIYTVNTEAQASRLIRAGATGITSDNRGLLSKASQVI